jgi:2'-5' RNA ligase
MHLTLRFIGEVSANTLADIEQKLRTIEFAPFSLSLKGVGVFPNENYVRVVWIGCENEELKGLAKKIEDALTGIGKEDARGFSAHLTIARVKNKIDVKAFLKAHAYEEFGSFEVRSFQLMRSELAFGKPPKYSVVKSFESKSNQ